MGGPIRKDRVFFYAGFDEHLLTVPSIMQFANGASTVVPQPADYDYTDKQLVLAAAQQLNTMAGAYPTTMHGNAAFAKMDYTLSQKQLAFVRLSTSRYAGTNNVFFDPSSQLTSYAESENGTEDVHTESVAASLVSAWTNKLATNLRAQFSRDLQQSIANSDQPLTKIYNLVAGFGRSSMLPRDTREHKLHIADTLSYSTGRVQWKFGGDFIQAWIYNYYPSMFGGEYYFDDVKVNPWTYAPMKYGEPLTPLRAYAHEVPRYYMQDFGTAVSHPNTRFYSAFMQDAIRVTRSFTLNVGVRYDLQTFEPGPLVSNPLYPPSGKVPTDTSQLFSPAGILLFPGRAQAAGVARRRRHLLHADSRDVRVAGRQRQRRNPKPALSRSHAARAGSRVSHLSQSAGELSRGSAGVHTASIGRQSADDAGFGLRTELSDAVRRAGEPDPGAGAWREDLQLRSVICTSTECI